MASGDSSLVSPIQSTMTFSKLRGKENFHTWSFAMECYLVDQDLWDIVSKPADLTTAANARKDARARSKICLACHENVYPVIQNVQTACDTWNNLKKAYADCGLVRRLSLMKKLLAVKYEGNMEKYVNLMLTTQQELRGMNAAIEDEFLAIILLANLPESYKPLVMTLEHSNTKITSEAVVSALLKEDSRPSPTTSLTVPDAALQCTVTKKKSFHSKKCTYCKRFGHYKNECKILKKKQETPSINTTNYTSHITLSSCFNVSHSSSSDSWYIDSGATSHMCNRKEYFREITPVIKPVTVANNDQILCEGEGTVVINNTNNINTIKDVLYVPQLAANLLSVSNLVKKGFIVLFSLKGATILRKEGCKVSGSIIATASNFNGMYKLNVPDSQALLTTSTESALLWHRRLGHLNTKAMSILKNKFVGINYNDTLNKICVPCLQGKLAKKPFNNSSSRSKNVLEIVHSDVCGPMSTQSWGKALYVLTFTDDFSRKTFGYFLKHKSEVFSKFVEFKSMVENQTGHKIKKFRSDCGSEYINRNMTTFLKENGILHQTSVPYNPQQNGISERVNRTIIEKARSMLQDANLSKAYWAEAVNTAIYLKNHSPTQALNNKIPEEIWTGKKINLSHLRVFGCEAHALIPVEKRTKLESKTRKYIFVGYSSQSKGFRLIDPQNPRVVLTARDVVFIEDKPSTSDTQDVSQSQTSDIIQVQDTETGLDMEIPKVSQTETTEVPNTEIQEISEIETPEVFFDSENETIVEHPHVNVESERRYSLRDRRPPIRYPNNDTLANLTSTNFEPETFKEAMEDVHKDNWLKSMEVEYDSLIKHGTWILVDRPSDRKIVKCKWVYKIKRDTSGNIIKYKARLVAKGFTQIYGVDYHETFSPVTRLSTVRLLIAYAVQHNLEVDHLDVETAFLYGTLDEEIYMTQPEGFIKEDSKNKVCLLKKALYGLKQSPRQWHKKVCEAMAKFGLMKSQNDNCVYYHKNQNKLLIVAIFVDDFFIFSNDKEMKQKFKSAISKEFCVKDLGSLKDCLGMRVLYTKNGITLDQTKYIEKLISKFGMSDAISVSTPMEPGQKLTYRDINDDQPDLPYQQLIGSLMYVSIGTRPDISHAVSFLSQFNTHYGEVHWRAAKRVLRYLKGTKDLKLHYHKVMPDYPIGYVDADHGSNIIDRRSFTGFFFIMSGAPISWESRKQKTVALSTTEAEYMALSEACKEAIYLKAFFKEIFSLDRPIKIYTDNQSSLKLSHNDTFHARTKHIDIRHHFIRDSLNQQNLVLNYINTRNMPADVLTKPLTKLRHFMCLKGLGITEAIS